MTQLTLNLKNDSEAIGEMKMSFSPVAFLEHANLTHKQEKGSAKRMNAIYGQKCLESFGRFNHVGLWAKTFSALLIGMEGWYSTKCKLTWKLKGTKYSRMYFQLQPSMLRTEGTEFGLLLKTPTVMDGEVSSGKKNPVSGDSGTLAQEIMSGYKPTMQKLGLLPTPTTQETPHYEAEITENGRRKAANGNSHSMNLADYALRELLPTPATRDYKGTNNLESMKEKIQNGERAFQGQLPNYIAVQTGKTSQLNPRFVMEMMGFPPDWTELPFLSGDKNPSKPEETP